MQYTHFVYTIFILGALYIFWLLNKEYTQMRMDMFIQRKTLESMGGEMENMQFVHSKIISEVNSYKRRQQSHTHQPPLIEETPLSNQSHSRENDHFNESPPKRPVPQDQQDTRNMQQNQPMPQDRRNANQPMPQDQQDMRIMNQPIPQKQQDVRNMNRPAPRAGKITQNQPVSVEQDEVDNINMASCEVEVQPFQ